MDVSVGRAFYSSYVRMRLCSRVCPETSDGDSGQSAPLPTNPCHHPGRLTCDRYRRMRSHQNASEETLARIRQISLALPEATEQRAWVGTRWCIRKRNFAHVVPIADGWPPAYVRATKSDGPITIVTFRTSPAEHTALAALGYPYFTPPWWPDIAGVVIDHHTDWTELAELITESYRLLAPSGLRRAM